MQKSFQWMLGLGLVAAGQLASAAEQVLEEVKVVGTRGSLMSAAGKQADADALISVVDSDAMGDFPDTTAAEAVRRLSGISIENDQGEGRYVTIRGLSSDLNAFAVNGASMVAPENGRSVLLDGVPTELLESITVSKSLTPDQDADSLGGRIEFRTKNPSDLRDTLVKFKVDTTYNEQVKSAASPRLSFNYGTRVSDQFAHVIGLTYSEKEIVTYNNETGYGWDSNGFMDDDYEMRYYDITRNRMGLTYDADYLVSDVTRVYGSLFWNQYTDEELRWKDEYGKIDRIEDLTNGLVSSRIRHDAETRVREETRTIWSANLGFETLAGEWAIDAQVSYSFAEEDDTDNADVTFRNYDKDLGGTFDWSNPTRPVVTALDPTLRDPDSLEFDEIEFEDSISQDSEVAISLNFEREVGNQVVKFGGKYRSREKDRDNNLAFYSFDGATMADFDPQTLAWPWAGQTFSQQASPSMVYALQSNRSQLTFEGDETFVEDFVTQEDIFAVYAMTTMDLGSARLVLGARYENTSMESEAFDQDGAATSASKDHSFFAPSVTLKYALSDTVSLRAAAWRALSRPGFTQSAPILELDINGEDVSGKYGNPDLEPYEATNLDLALEYYDGGFNYASFGVFRKDVDNAIYPTIQKEALINGISFNDGVETYINADQSKLTGLEASVQFGMENGLFFSANVTHMLDNESTFAFEDTSAFTTPFRKLADDAANLSVGYDKGPWDVRLALNYRSSYLDYLADEEGAIDSVSADNSRFTDDHTQWDLTAKYKINKQLTVKFEAINIGDEPEFYYWGSASRLSQYDEYGTSYTLGMTYLFGGN